MVFDFDGIILNTEEPEFLAWQEVFKNYQSDLSLDKWQITIGTRNVFDPIEELKKTAKVPLPSTEEIYHQKRQIVAKLLENQPVMDGVLDWLEELKKRDIKVAIASSSSQQWVEHHLERLNIRHYFVTVVGYSSYIRPKPYPDSYEQAIKILQANPSNSLAIEDSSWGVRAAKLTGLKVLAIPHRLTAQTDFSQADLIANSLDQITIDEVYLRLT